MSRALSANFSFSITSRIFNATAHASVRTGNINVQETENVIFEGAQAAVARINLDGAPSDALLTAMQSGNADILDLHLVAI